MPFSISPGCTGICSAWPGRGVGIQALGQVEGDGTERSFKGRRVWRRRPAGTLSTQDCVPVSPQVQPAGWEGGAWNLYAEPEMPRGAAHRGTSPFSASAVHSGD